MGASDDVLGRLADLNRKLGESDLDPSAWSQIVDALPDGVVVVADDGKIRLVNAQIELTFGYHRTRLVGESVHKLLPPDLAAAHAGHLERFFASPTARPMNLAKVLPGRHITGRVVHVQVSIGPLVSEAGVFGLAVVRRVVGAG